MRKTVIVLLAFLSSLLFFQAFAQESTNYSLKEHVFNEGGHPEQGTVLTSTSYTITIDAIGESVIGDSLTSDSYQLDGGFVSPYLPPGEVMNLFLQADHDTLSWDLEKSKGSYNLYRGPLSDLASYGSCKESKIPDETTTDLDDPDPGQGYFYLVTVRNRLDEEGTKGYGSDSERDNYDPCL